MIIRKLRLEKGWSQEQLAQVAGVSTRTIQRIESGDEASIETIKCLAAVFEIDFTKLKQDINMIDNNLSQEDRAALDKMRELMKYADKGQLRDMSLSHEEREAREYVRNIKIFYTHLITYLSIMGFLLILNLFTNPSYLWVIWPAMGWGIGIFIHALSVFEISPLFSNEWEKRQIKKYLNKK